MKITERKDAWSKVPDPKMPGHKRACPKWSLAIHFSLRAILQLELTGKIPFKQSTSRRCGTGEVDSSGICEHIPHVNLQWWASLLHYIASMEWNVNLYAPELLEESHLLLQVLDGLVCVALCHGRQQELISLSLRVTQAIYERDTTALYNLISLVGYCCNSMNPL